MICWHKLYHFTVANTRFTAPLTRRGKTKFATIKWYNLCQQIIQSQTCYPLIFACKTLLYMYGACGFFFFLLILVIAYTIQGPKRNKTLIYEIWRVCKIYGRLGSASPFIDFTPPPPYFYRPSGTDQISHNSQLSGYRQQYSRLSIDILPFNQLSGGKVTI